MGVACDFDLSPFISWSARDAISSAVWAGLAVALGQVWRFKRQNRYGRSEPIDPHLLGNADSLDPPRNGGG